MGHGYQYILISFVLHYIASVQSDYYENMCFMCVAQTYPFSARFAPLRLMFSGQHALGLWTTNTDDFRQPNIYMCYV